MTPKPQRIRDPVHNLVEFNTSDQLERTLWAVIQTPPFQRLRRIRQLGFSELVFPGATHTRFAHSIGVFHVARMLVQVIKRQVTSEGRPFLDRQAQVALAAALVHDVGHGMFSHAFEAIGTQLNLPMAHHERVSAALIGDSELTAALNKELGRSFADEVAALIAQKGPGNLYDAVVSSQFDADRLDYMQRDRLMTGVQSSGIDLTWLLANLEIRPVRTGADDDPGEEIETLVLGPKAVQTAESYVLSLFHLYPNVYLHKTTRGAEAMFSALMRRLLRLGANGHGHTGLPHNHPILRFAREPGSLDRAKALDDLVFWGALPMLTEAADKGIARLAIGLMNRELPVCTDLRQRVDEAMPRVPDEPRDKRQARVALACARTEAGLKAWADGERDGVDRIMFDRYDRAPYKRYDNSDTPLNRILIRTGKGPPTDMAESSPVVAGAETFSVRRVYTFRRDDKARDMVENIMGTEIGRAADADT